MTVAALPSLSLLPDANGVLRVSGVINYANAAAAWRAAPRSARNGDAIDVDLAGLADADSAALAVLIAWQAQARANGARLRYRNAPQALQNLARLSDVGDLLGVI